MTDEKRFWIRKMGEHWVVYDYGCPEKKFRTFAQCCDYLQWAAPAAFR